MRFTFLEKLKIGTYAACSAITTGTTAYGATAAVSINNPYLVAFMILGAAACGSVHTVLSRIKQSKKDLAKKERSQEQHEDQERLIKQLIALKPKVEELLSAKEQEKKADEAQRKKPINHSPLSIEPDSPAARVAQVRKETAIKNRKRAKEWRQTQLLQMQYVLDQLDKDQAQPSSPTAVQSKPTIKKTEEKPRNTLEKIARIGLGLGNGFAKAGAAAFGFVKAGAALGKTTVELFAPAMVAPVVMIGVAGGLENAYQANQDYEKELQEEEQHKKYQAKKHELQAAYDVIISLLATADDEKPAKKKVPSDPSLPGAVPDTASSKSDESASLSLAATFSQKTKSSQPPAAVPEVAITIRPATPSSGAPKEVPKPKKPNRLPSMPGDAKKLPPSPMTMFKPKTPRAATPQSRPATSPAS